MPCEKRNAFIGASNEHSLCQKSTSNNLSLRGQTRAAILEMDVALLHSDDGIDKLI